MNKRSLTSHMYIMNNVKYVCTVSTTATDQVKAANHVNSGFFLILEGLEITGIFCVKYNSSYT